MVPLSAIWVMLLAAPTYGWQMCVMPPPHPPVRDAPAVSACGDFP